MSKLGKALINTIEESKIKGFVTLRISPEAAVLLKDLIFLQWEFTEIVALIEQTRNQGFRKQK